MNSCTSIITWEKDGCDPSVINQDYVRNVKHWTGEKSGGLAHNEKFQTDESERLLQELRNKTMPLTVKDVENVFSVESKSLDTQDVGMSDISDCNISDLLADSESDDDGMIMVLTILILLKLKKIVNFILMSRKKNQFQKFLEIRLIGTA